MDSERLGLTFGSAKRVLPRVLDALIFANLTLDDVARLYLLSHSLSKTVKQFLAAMKVLRYPEVGSFIYSAPAAKFSAEKEPSRFYGLFALELVIKHCRSLTTIIDCFAGSDSCAAAVIIKHNRATLRQVLQRRWWTSFNNVMLLRLTECPLLENFEAYTDTNFDSPFNGAVADRVTAKNLPRLQSLSLGGQNADLWIGRVLKQEFPLRFLKLSSQELQIYQKIGTFVDLQRLFLSFTRMTAPQAASTMTSLNTTIARLQLLETLELELPGAAHKAPTTLSAEDLAKIVWPLPSLLELRLNCTKWDGFLIVPTIQAPKLRVLQADNMDERAFERLITLAASFEQLETFSRTVSEKYRMYSDEYRHTSTRISRSLSDALLAGAWPKLSSLTIDFVGIVCTDIFAALCEPCPKREPTLTTAKPAHKFRPLHAVWIVMPESPPAADVARFLRCHNSLRTAVLRIDNGRDEVSASSSDSKTAPAATAADADTADVLHLAMERLSLDCATERCFAHASFPFLKSLTLRSQAVRLPSIDAVFAACPQLTHLHIVNVAVGSSPPSKPHTNITNLHLQSTPTLAHMSLLAALPNLTTLKVQANKRDFVKLLAAIASPSRDTGTLKHVTAFTLTVKAEYGADASADEIKGLINALPSLRELVVPVVDTVQKAVSEWLGKPQQKARQILLNGPLTFRYG